MPVSRTYTVTQTRSVEVFANDPVNATRIAEMAFVGVTKAYSSRGVEDQIGAWGYATDAPVPIEMTVKEKTYT